MLIHSPASDEFDLGNEGSAAHKAAPISPRRSPTNARWSSRANNASSDPLVAPDPSLQAKLKEKSP